MVILGIDPGYATVGFGVVDYAYGKFTPIRFGAITTPAEMCVVELFKPNDKTPGIDVAQARGVILLAAQQRGVPVYEYTPMQVKQSVVGYGLAEKQQVMEMTRRLLGLEKVPRPDDTADALALAICHAHCAGSLLAKYR